MLLEKGSYKKMNIDGMITGVTVVHNTKDLIQRAYESVRKFHPKMKIIIVDGSDQNDDCYNYVCSLADKNTRVFHSDENIGHGRGLCVGIEYVETPYFLIFDSDIEMLESPVQAMLDMMEEDTLGVGYTEKTAFDGFEWGCKPIHKTQGWMRYLHPYFCLLQMKEYLKYQPFCHHGAPAVNLCLDTYNKGLNEKVIKEFEGLGHSSGKGWVWEGKERKYIRHDTRGTRDVRIKKRKSEIEGKWEEVIKVFSPRKIDTATSSQHGNITCITCTGDRPKAFELCLKWMEKQTLKPTQWIIIDDGKVPIEIPNLPYVYYIRRNPCDTDPKHTMILNIKQAIKYITEEKVIIWEDDEYYASKYIETMANYLDKYEIVGIGRNKYYHVILGTYFTHANMGHASLAQTAFRKTFLPELNRIMEGNCFLDIRIWDVFFPNESCTAKPGVMNCVSKDGRACIFEDMKYMYVGMKGLPGRTGIGSGHKGMGAVDYEGSVLKKWVIDEEAFKLYRKFFIRQLSPQRYNLQKPQTVHRSKTIITKNGNAVKRVLIKHA
jgi:hypothetical protein